jgi:uncharacterized protein YjbI with pentapeptide repeats
MPKEKSIIDELKAVMSEPSPKQGDLSDELKFILSEHKKFVESKGRYGSRASFKKVSLRGKNFKGADLRGAVFQGTKLQRVNFQYANLAGAYLKGTDLTEAKLQWADLSGANLEQAIFRDAKMAGINLGNSNLCSAIFKGASMTKANLAYAKLNGVDLCDLNLTEIDMSYANLSGVNLDNSILTKANLENSNLESATLKNAILSQANLHKANLIYADLREANLSKANISGANLYQCALNRWIIADIECDYIYFDKESLKKHPSDRLFNKGEFEEIHKTLPTIEYYFEQGFTIIDQLLIDKIILEINEEYPEMGLVLDSFQAKGFCPHIKLTVSKSEYQEVAYLKLKARYEELEKIYKEEKMRFTHVIHALIDKGGSEVHYHKVDKMIGSSIGGNSEIKTQGPDSPIQIGLDKAMLSYKSAGALSDAIDKIAEENPNQTTFLAKIKDELLNLPVAGIKALSGETINWLKSNVSGLLSVGGEEIKSILEKLHILNW